MFSIYADDVLVFSSRDPNATMRHITSPQANGEIGRAGGLTFTILPTHPAYSTIRKFKTKITAKLNTRLIFIGRVIDDSKDIYNVRKVTCEGALSFLLDSVQSPRPGNVTVRHFLTSCLAEHNQQVEDSKKFTIGNVTIPEAEEEINQNIDSYQDTKSALEKFLIGVYGGYLVVRTEASGNYIDYLKEYPATQSAQEIRLKKNLLDITQKESVANIFTVLLPIGKYPDDYVGQIPEDGVMDISSVNGGSKYIEHTGSIAKYGRIVRPEQFNNPKSPQELLTAAQAFMARHLDQNPTHLTVKVIDLHLLDTSIEQFILGNKYRIISDSNNIDITLTLVAIKWDFQNPENTELTLENPIQEKGEKVLKKQESSLSRILGGGGGRGGSSGSGGGVAGLYKFITETEDTLQLQAKNVNILGENVNVIAENFTVQAEHILLTAQRLDDTTGQLVAAITVEANRITSEVSRATANESSLSGRITVEADRITQTISTMTNNVEEIHSRILQTKELISLEVNGRTSEDSKIRGELLVTASEIRARVGTVEGDLEDTYGQILATQTQVNLRVKKGEVVSEINVDASGVQISGKKIQITGTEGIAVIGDLAVDGDVRALRAEFNSLIAGRGSFTSLKVNGTYATWKTAIIAGITIRYLGY